MKQKRVYVFLITVVLLCVCIAGCAAPVVDGQNTGSPVQENSGGDMVSFRPVDCGIQAQEVYAYPYIGLTVTLPVALQEKLDSREIFLYNFDAYTADTVSYAMMRFSAPTEQQRSEEGMSVDIFSWEEALPKVGVIGVYEKSLIAQLDDLTLCDTHKKLGESSDGNYEYYLSTSTKADAALTSELAEKSRISLTEMQPVDLENGYGAFATPRIEGLASVGNFTTMDVFGTAYDQTVFAGYDLTLVNLFATWCSPCVQEMPELEQLRQECAAKGIKLGVIAMVMDAKNDNGTDSDAIEKAKKLSETSRAQFPFLIPEETMLNGRLEGIMAYPESFFVDGNGNIVSDPYVGAKSQADWYQIVETELADLKGSTK